MIRAMGLWRASSALSERWHPGTRLTFRLVEPDLQDRADQVRACCCVQGGASDLEKRLNGVENEDERVLARLRQERQQLGQSGGSLCWVDVLLQLTEEAVRPVPSQSEYEERAA